MTAEVAMARISILGSCVTRDAFEVSEVLNKAIVFYAARTSLASIIADPIEVAIPETPGVSSFELRCLRADLEKSFFDSLMKSMPDVLFVDLIDERYPICVTQSSRFSYNPILTQIGALSELEAATRLEKGSKDGLHLWMLAIDTWAATIRRLFPNLVIVFVDARFALNSRAPIGTIDAEAGAMLNWCHASNRMLVDMKEKFLGIFPDSRIISPPETLWVSDEDHRWGKQPFHYVREWYDYVAASALEIVNEF